ncbi:hypothetical protein Mgra_00003776, partial [Meloidogyne graminicola]
EIGESSKNNEENKKINELEEESLALSTKISKFINEEFNESHFPHIYFPDPQINNEEEEDMDILQKLMKYSKNFNQLMECIKFINLEENKLISSIKKIKKSKGN